MMKMCFQYRQFTVMYIHMTLDACAVPARLSPTTYVSLEREISGWLIEARSGHGHFAA